MRCQLQYSRGKSAGSVHHVQIGLFIDFFILHVSSKFLHTQQQHVKHFVKEETCEVTDRVEKVNCGT